MRFELPKLSYANDALVPYISAETLELHHGKHHAAYIEKLNDLVAGTEWEDMRLEEIIRRVGPGPLFNNAAQHWNHSFYWECMSPDGGGEPAGDLAEEIRGAFGDFESFRRQFSDAATTLFGSGWVWLVKPSEGRLRVVCTPDAENPLIRDQVPLLACDVWEHAYYVDYRNEKPKYVEAFWNVINWPFVGSRV